MRDKAITLRWVTLGVGIALFILSGINSLLFLKYKQQEDINAQVASDVIVREVEYVNNE